MSNESPGNGPKVTEESIKALVVEEAYHRFPGTTVTVCCLTLANGYNSVGVSACADPANFDAEYGMKLAREEAANKVWALEGYLLRQRLHDGEVTGGIPNDEVDALVEDLASNG